MCLLMRVTRPPRSVTWTGISAMALAPRYARQQGRFRLIWRMGRRIADCVCTFRLGLHFEATVRCVAPYRYLDRANCGDGDAGGRWFSVLGSSNDARCALGARDSNHANGW